MLGSSLASAFAGFTNESQVGRIGLVLFFAEAAIFYGLATWMQKQPRLVHLTTLMACGSVWQMLAYFAVGTQAYMLVFAVIGLLLLVAYRLSFWEKTAAAPLAQSFFQASNTLLSLAFVSSVFHSFFGIIGPRLGVSTSTGLDLGFVGFCLTMLIVSLIAMSMTRQDSWRRWYVVTSLAEGAITLLAVHQLIDLSPWQQIELFSVLTGLLLLCVGHVGWHREHERESDMVSTSLLFGALLASVPLAVATWHDRYHGEFRDQRIRVLVRQRAVAGIRTGLPIKSDNANRRYHDRPVFCDPADSRSMESVEFRRNRDHRRRRSSVWIWIDSRVSSRSHPGTAFSNPATRGSLSRIELAMKR